MNKMAPPTADDGLFGPESVTWQVHGDPSMAFAGLRALLLQALHPLVMAGVAQHSDFRSDPWRRLQRTAGFVGVTTYGTVVDAERAGARVRTMHRQLSGVDPNSGRAYEVSDPHLLCWVHVCQAESFLSTYRRCGGLLRPGDGDRYYLEMRRAAALVGCPDVPTTEVEVATYLASMRRELQLTREAREAAVFIMAPPMPRWVTWTTPARPAWLAMGTLAFAMLPRWARRLYRLPGLPTTDLGATMAARSFRAALAAVPAAALEGPYRKAARERLGRAS